MPHGRMRVAIFTVGTRGDVQPLLALALALQRAGHSVVLCANDNFRGWVERHGVRFTGAGCGQLDQSGWREASSFGAFIEHTVRQTGALYATMGAAFYRCAQETLVGEAGGGGAALVVCTMFTQTLGTDIAEKVGAACAVLKWAPDALPTGARPPFGCPSPRVARWLPRSALLNKATHYAQLLSSVLASERAGMGATVAAFRTDVLQLPPMPLGDRLKRLGELANIYAVGEALLPTPSDWPPNATTTGFFFLEEACAPPSGGGAKAAARASVERPETQGEGASAADEEGFSRLREWVLDHPRPVVINFGSMACLDEVDVPTNAVRAEERRQWSSAVATDSWGAQVNAALGLGKVRPTARCPARSVVPEPIRPAGRGLRHGLGRRNDGSTMGRAGVRVREGAARVAVQGG